MPGLLRLSIDELYFDRPAKVLADRLMFKIFELRDHMSDIELEVIRQEFDKILEITADDPYRVDTGMPILFSCLTMNQITGVEEYIDDLLDILVRPNKVKKTAGHIFMIARRFPDKVKARLDKIKILGIDDPDYQAIRSELKI